MYQEYPDFFNVTLPQLNQIIAAALSEGGDWCDLYFENTVYNDLLLKDSEVTSGGFQIDRGVGVRVLKGDKTGYAYAENNSMPDMLAAARAASVIARRATPSAPFNATATPASPSRSAGRDANPDASHIPGLNADRDASLRTSPYAGQTARPDNTPNNFYPAVPTTLTHSEMLPLLNRLEASLKGKDPRIVKVIARLADSESRIMMYNSLGELTADTRPMTSLVVSAIFTQGGLTESKTVSRSFRSGLEMVTDGLIEELAAEAAAGIDERFEAKRPKGGRMSVVMRSGASGILLHEAMGHAFEADFNRKGQSVFAGRMGRKICDPAISIVDDATIPRNRGSLNFDDEGVPGQRTMMVTHGVLTSYLHDRVSAAHYGVAPTGNGRRESFRYNPIPRMRATYMEAGNADPSDIIASVRKGLYVEEFSNGQVKIGEGDFTFFVKSGRLIENGRLTMPVKDINVIGNGPKALADITAVGNDLRIDNGTWTCGKEQSVPVSQGIPTVLVSSLTVGGE